MRTVLALTLLLLSSLALRAPADAQENGRVDRNVRLSLSQAIELGLRTDPGVLEALVGKQRGDLAVLRAQLDRITLQINGSLSEQWNANNVFGSQGPASCYGALPATGADGSPLLAAVPLVTPAGGTPTQAQCGLGYSPASGPIQTNAYGLLNLSANLNVPVFSGFRVSANVARAQHQRDAASATIRQSQRDAALGILRAYWMVRGLELQREVSQQAIARYDDQLQVVRARVRAGLAPPVDVNRTEVRRQAELSRQADLIGAEQEARARLAVALGLPSGPDMAIDLTEDASVSPPPPADPRDADAYLDQALHNRPEMAVARYQLRAGKDQVTIAKADYYPQLSGSALLQFGNNPFNPLLASRQLVSTTNPFLNTSGSIFAGATLSINLFDTLHTYTNVRDARYEVERLTQEERRLGRLVEADVRTAHAHLVRLYNTRQPLVATRDLAKDTLDIVEKRYRNGDALVIEYIDAQVDLLNAEINLANSAAAIAQAWGELQAATGRIPGR